MKQPMIETIPVESEANKRLTEELINTYHTMVSSWVFRRVRHRQETEELMQEWCIKLYRYPRKSGVENMQSFVFTVAQNLVRDWSRRTPTRKWRLMDELESAPDELLTVDDNPLDKLISAQDEADLTQLVKAAIDSLPEQQKRTYILHKVQGKTHAQVAKVICRSISAVEKHIMKANKSIKQYVLNAA